MVGSGEQLQQPVYVEDVVEGILAAVRCPAALGRAYALAGPQALTYNQLIDQVGFHVKCKPVKIHLPLSLALAGVWTAERLGRKVSVGRAQLLRQQEDKSCSIEAARNEFGFAPLSFAAGLAQVCRQKDSAAG